jgi:hypothetical protein
MAGLKNPQQRVADPVSLDRTDIRLKTAFAAGLLRRHDWIGRSGVDTPAAPRSKPALGSIWDCLVLLNKDNGNLLVTMHDSVQFFHIDTMQSGCLDGG